MHFFFLESVSWRGEESDVCSPLFFSAPHSSSVWQHSPALSERRCVSPPPALPVSGRFQRHTVREDPMPGWHLRGAAIQPDSPPPPTRGPDSPAGSSISHPLPAGHPGPYITLRGKRSPQRHSQQGLQSWVSVRGHTTTEKKCSLDAEEKEKKLLFRKPQGFLLSIMSIKVCRRWWINWKKKKKLEKLQEKKKIKNKNNSTQSLTLMTVFVFFWKC